MYEFTGVGPNASNFVHERTIPLAGGSVALAAIICDCIVVLL